LEYNFREILYSLEGVGQEVDNSVTLFFTSHFDFFKELASNRQQGILRPGMEPVNNCAIDNSGELTGTSSEFITRRHAESHMKVSLDSVNEVFPNGSRSRVNTITLSSRSYRVDDSIHIFLNEEISNFSRRK